jgi:hypothetical protein
MIAPQDEGSFLVHVSSTWVVIGILLVVGVVSAFLLLAAYTWYLDCYVIPKEQDPHLTLGKAARDYLLPEEGRDRIQRRSSLRFWLSWLNLTLGSILAAVGGGYLLVGPNTTWHPYFAIPMGVVGLLWSGWMLSVRLGSSNSPPNNPLQRSGTL